MFLHIGRGRSVRQNNVTQTIKPSVPHYKIILYYKKYAAKIIIFYHNGK